MTTNKDDGGPAFPHVVPVHEYETGMAGFGMTLRDFFAGQALAGFCADTETVWTPQQIAECAYKQADAMLAERAKPHVAEEAEKIEEATR